MYDEQGSRLDEMTNMKAKPQRKRTRRALIAIGVVVAVLAGGFAWYVNDYSRADADALAAVADADGGADGVIVQTLAGGRIAFIPEHADAGLIFYPGGKVQPEAYAPLLTRCAQNGILCVLVKPPFNLAVFDVGAAGGVAAQFPDVEKWLIGGHSLGGAVASVYLAHHDDSFSGIVFLAAYPSDDLSETDVEALSVVGNNDGVLDRQRYDDAESNMPSRKQEIVIEGGNHANFGNYGTQAGDGKATISREDQQARTAVAIAELAD